jgi:hypothetical protein
MTNYKIVLLFSLLFLMGCIKDENENPIITDPPMMYNNKKGADFNTESVYGSWYGNVVNLKSHWFYTWGTTLPFEQQPKNVEFVSMFWGKANVTDANIDYVKKWKDSGKIKYVLGFNEPDLGDQSNMSVDDALALWPKLESIGLPLGSPAASWPTRDWIYSFLDKAIAQHRRVDFICVHMYVGLDDVDFVKVLVDLNNKYHLPIWITEFGTADQDATTMAANRYTAEQVQGFMQRLLPKLDSLPFVQRYSWFSGSPTSTRLWPSALVAADSTLTPLGKIYAAHFPNTAVAPH